MFQTSIRAVLRHIHTFRNHLRRITVQCTRCWLWHNARSCASNPRCRLCGSSSHLEDKHGNLCAATGAHSCPNRCIHCHGPHSADDKNCELRPKTSGTPKTKAQVSEIRRINAAARMRKQAEAGCVKRTTSSSQTADCRRALMTQPAQDSIASHNPYGALAVEVPSDAHIHSS